MAFYCNGLKGVCKCDILCVDCKHYDNSGGKDVQTNADRIRAMSDEELADWLARTQVENVKEVLEALHITYEGKAEALEYVKRECLEWLKQPAEVDNG